MRKRRDASGGRGPRPISDSLRTVTAGFGSRGRAIDLGERWADVVGEAIAAHAQPERLEAGCLMVVVDDPAWATEVRYHSSRIVDALNAQADAPQVSELRLRVQR